MRQRPVRVQDVMVDAPRSARSRLGRILTAAAGLAVFALAGAGFVRRSCHLRPYYLEKEAVDAVESIRDAELERFRTRGAYAALPPCPTEVPGEMSVEVCGPAWDAVDGPPSIVAECQYQVLLANPRYPKHSDFLVVATCPTSPHGEPLVVTASRDRAPAVR